MYSVENMRHKANLDLQRHVIILCVCYVIMLCVDDVSLINNYIYLSCYFLFIVQSFLQ